MQKLVIHTQYKENYGAHDWDGKGECPQYWKFKGGTTYVVPNFKDFNNVESVIKSLEALITYSNDGSKEYILEWSIVPHSQKVCEDWESPTNLWLNPVGKWEAIKVTDNREDGWMRKEILEKTETWTLLPEGDRANYKAEFLMEDGEYAINDEGLRDWIGNRDEIVLPEVG
tara:strand:- start:61 stop:573 length:513 start_codon:yes stop_codon:yes gene_type:complete